MVKKPKPVKHVIAKAVVKVVAKPVVKVIKKIKPVEKPMKKFVKKQAKLNKKKVGKNVSSPISKSQNGWNACADRNLIHVHNYIIPGANQHIAVCDDAAPVLIAFLAELNLITPINAPGTVFDDWGYGVGDNRGIDAMLSNHASGTAVDINATKHIQGGTKSGYTPQQEKQINALCNKYQLRWGFNYHSNKDPMHFEINTSVAQVKSFIATLKLPTPQIMK